MYRDEYKRWLEADLIDCDLRKELLNIADDDEAIKERFAVSLQFGTAGLFRRGHKPYEHLGCPSGYSGCR